MPSDKPTNLFRSLDAQGSMQIYPKIKKNAEQHFNAAELLAGAGDQANGIAHLILGSEELVKSFVLFLQAYDFPIKKVANYDMLFSRHYARHNLLKEFYSIYRFIAGVLQWPKWNKDHSFLSNLVKVLRYGSDVLNIVVHNHGWWDQADELKQRCFYLDYTSLGLNDPATFDLKAFEEARALTKKFREDLGLMVVIIERASPEDLNELRQAFVTTGMTEQINESITRKKAK